MFQGTEPFTIEQLKRFFSTFGNTRHEQKLKTLFLTQFYLGLRINTACKFNKYYLSFKERTYRVRNDKGKKRYKNKGQRTMPLPNELFLVLRNYWIANKDEILENRGYFFPTSKSKYISTWYARKSFREHISRAGLDYWYKTEKREMGVFNTHSLRKTYAVYLLDNTEIDIFTLMSLLGHTTPLSTLPYVNLSIQKKREFVDLAFERVHVRKKEEALRLIEHDKFLQKTVIHPHSSAEFL